MTRLVKPPRTSADPSAKNADPAARLRASQTPEDAAFNKIVGRLKAMYVETDRDEEIRFELRQMVDNIIRPRDPDRPPSAANMREGTCLFIVGEPGAGKTTALRHCLKEHPSFPGYGDPDSGCQLISISAPSPFIMRTLGMALLRGAGYRTKREFRENEAWTRARFQLSESMILVVHIEDIQDLLQQKDPKEIKKVLAALKIMMTDLDSPPLHLIFTALSDVVSVLELDFQVPRRAAFVELKPVDPAADFGMIKSAASEYGKVAKISVRVMSSREIVGRLCHAARYQLGLVFELLVLAIEVCLKDGRKLLTKEDFADAYSRRTLEPLELNPFFVDDWISIDTSIIQRNPEEILAEDLVDDPPAKKSMNPKHGRGGKSGSAT